MHLYLTKTKHRNTNPRKTQEIRKRNWKRNWMETGTDKWNRKNTGHSTTLGKCNRKTKDISLRWKKGKDKHRKPWLFEGDWRTGSGKRRRGEGSGAGKVTKRSCYWCSWVVTAGGNEMKLYCRQGTMGLIIHHSGVVRVGGNDMQLYCRRWTAGLVIHHYCVVTGCRSNWRWDYFLMPVTLAWPWWNYCIGESPPKAIAFSSS
jgi:hypothetical protein